MSVATPLVAPAPAPRARRRADVRAGHGRRSPYSAVGIKRLPCARCGARAHAGWTICADGNLHRPICAGCDVALNELVMRWIWGDAREADIEAYRRKVLGS